MLIAKSNPKESLREHTMELIKRFNQLKESYGNTIQLSHVWDLLYLAALYHDTGKAYSYFQYQIKRNLGQELEKPELSHIPHNYLSPFFLPLAQLRLPKHQRRILIEAITYHHERDFSPNIDQLIKVAKKDLYHKFEQVEKELGIEVPEDDRFFYKIVDDMNRRRTKLKDNDENYLTYVLVKGLLHRLDHAASAHVDLEIDADFDLAKLTMNYLKKLTSRNSGYLRPLQEFAYKHQNKNLILTAQTGMGKTEAALIWAGKKKTFFTVPLRVSLNALYDRVSSDMDYHACGLLHSTSAHHLDEKGIENWEVIYDQSVHFSNKIIFTTIDQILKFPLRFRGYEKYYATLAHSCIVIDEIQAYSPWVVAIVIKALKMIHNIGGKFMIMTATLPQIYLDTLQEVGVIDDNCLVEKFYDDSYVRHCYTLNNRSILDDINQMIMAGKQEKVLVIANTVDQAVQLYQEISSDGSVDVYLFHARFLQKDRQILETSLKKFDKNRQRTGIWITTQIVEASIDIDFDKLYTELAPLDSLFQRFGRCYRKRKLQDKKNNINIYTEEVSGHGTVYDADILEYSRNFLEDHLSSQGSIILESQKMEMVEKLYSKETLIGTNFYRDFQKAMLELEQIEDHTYTYQDAQKLLRGDHAVMVIPRKVYDSIIHLFEKLEVEYDQKKRVQIRREIESFTCSVNKYRYKQHLYPIEHYRKTKSGKYRLMNHVYILEKDYDFDVETLAGIGIVDEETGWEVF